MVREILKIYTDNDLPSNPSFHGIELSEYEYKPSRMGIPTLTATLMWGKCLNDEWTGREYVELRGERFYIRHTPSSEKSNTDERYKHSIEFNSEFDEILSNVYFEDYVPSGYVLGNLLTYDKPCSNSSVFTFYGTISEFSDRLNCAFIKAGVGDSILKTKTNLTTLDTPAGDGFCSMIDPYGDYDPDKSYEFSFEKQTLWEAITSGYNTTEIPFERRARKIVWGAEAKTLSRTFRYGFDNELLKIGMNNAKAKVINRVTMLGSSENIPYYYPNETEYGHIAVKATSGNKVLTDSMIEVVNRTQMLAYLPPDTPAVLSRRIIETSAEPSSANKIDSYAVSFGNNLFQDYTLGKTVSSGTMGNVSPQYSHWNIRIKFDSAGAKENILSKMDGQVWYTNSSSGPSSFQSILSGAEIVSFTVLENGSEKDMTRQASKTNSSIDLGTLNQGRYTLTLRVRINPPTASNTYSFNAFFALYAVEIESQGISASNSQTGGTLCWKVGDKIYDGEGSLGIKIIGGAKDSMLGDSFQWTATERMPFQERLVPPKYRDTKGEERFYNAYNEPYSEEYANTHKDAYIDPDTQEPYEFTNPFAEGAPSEYIYENEDIKPTIEGVRNAEGLPMGMIADIAFDSDDNDSIAPENSEDDKNDSLKYEHSFFYIRLNKFDGSYGFDLIKHYSQTDPMTIQMTSGSCNGCKFKVQVVELEDETGLKYYKNPVQVYSDGSIVNGGYADKVNKGNIIESQQNTETGSIWLCVQKDADTFGVIMPNQEHKYLPKAGDTFNIINIDLPDAYIRSAEKRLEEEGMRYMSDNNEEKFTFDITASRIFFAEHPEVLAELDEYSKIKVEYDGKVYVQYVSSLSINCKSNEPLPEIKIDLADTIAVGQSFQQRQEERMQSLIANATNLGGGAGGSGGISTALADRRYLNKQKADRTPHKLSTDTAFEVGEFVSGASGGIFYRDPETGQTYIEVDKLKVRLKAIFEELEIAHTSSIGGQQIITPGGGIDISYVEELSDVYRCYFKAKEENEGAKCRFVAGDQVKCQEFNIQAGTAHNASNKYYWRLVVAVNNDESYVDISKSDCDQGSDIPEAGDTIVQLGNRNDKARQSAIVHSTVDAFAPCVTLFDGINSYSLEGKEVIQYGVDKTKNPPQPFFHCYGSFYYGPKDRSSYLEFDPSLGYLVFKGTLLLQSQVQDDKGNTQALQDYLESLIPDIEKDDIADIVNDIVDPQLAEMQKQLDGVIETWFGDGVPSLKRDEYPMREWEEPGRDWNDILEAHAGDLYYDNETGYAYRFSKEGDKWTWVTITDEAITKALAAAAEAKKTAEGAEATAQSKSRIFVDTPFTPYEEGDLWVNATYPKGATRDEATYYDDILKCKTTRLSGAFNISDWGYASSYPEEIAGYAYLKEATNQGTLVNGGLVLTSLIQLGFKSDTSATWQCWSGINGIPLADAKKGYGIAAWYGGDMLDGEMEEWVNPSQKRYAKSLFRFDGSGYLSGGAISWNKDGQMTFNTNISVGGQKLEEWQTNIANLTQFLNALGNVLVPVDIGGNILRDANNRLDWGHKDMVAVRVYKKGLYADTFISAMGINSETGSGGTGSGGTGGGGLNEEQLADYLTRNNYAKKSDIATELGKYLPLTGGTITGNLDVEGYFWIKSSSGEIGFNILDNRFFGPTVASNGKFELGRSDARWSTLYANSINVTNTALVASLNADMLDGKHNGELTAENLSYLGNTEAIGGTTAIDKGLRLYGVYNNGYPCMYGNLLRIGGGGGGELLAEWTGGNGLGRLYYRSKRDVQSEWSGWGTVAYLTDNVASATQLQTSRNLWGQPFNGTGDVDGVMEINYTGNEVYNAFLQATDPYIPVNGHGGLAFGRAKSINNQAQIWHTHIGDGSTNNYLSFGAWGKPDLMIVRYDGSVGIGTTTLPYKFTVNGDILADGWIRVRGGGNRGFFFESYGGGFYMQDSEWIRTYGSKNFYHDTGIMRTDGEFQVGINGNRLIVKPGGNVGIGTTNPVFTLDVRGTGYFSGNVTAEANLWVELQLTATRVYAVAGIWSDGYVSAMGQNTSSDERLKMDFMPLKLTLEQIANAPSVMFRWKKDGSLDFGSIAQYWQHINPLFAREHKGYLTLDYGKIAMSGLIAVSNEVLNDKARISQLEREVGELKAKLKGA